MKSRSPFQESGGYSLFRPPTGLVTDRIEERCRQNVKGNLDANHCRTLTYNKIGVIRICNPYASGHSYIKSGRTAFFLAARGSPARLPSRFRWLWLFPEPASFCTAMTTRCFEASPICPASKGLIRGPKPDAQGARYDPTKG